MAESNETQVPTEAVQLNLNIIFTTAHSTARLE